MKTVRQLSSDTLQAVADILKVISHPVKLEILQILEQEEPLDVSTIHGRIDAHCESSMLSHHLLKMKAYGVLSSEKAGKQVYYRIADRKLLRIFDCMANCDFI